MNILVTGANGQLGQEIKKRVLVKGNGHPDHLACEPNYYIFAGHDDLDITNREAVAKYVKEHYINVIVNCAAYTNVDKAQTDRDNAYAVNATGPMNLAFAATSVGAVLIHISTDYVFGGTGRNTPLLPLSVGEDPVRYPEVNRDECFYGYSKSVGEHLIQQVKGANYIIIRTAWLYSAYGKNFVKTMTSRAMDGLQTKVVFDQTGSPTFAGDLADFILHIIEDNNADTRYLSKTGVYNFANKGVASWYDVAYQIFFRSGNEKKLSACRSSEYPSAVKRPSYSVFDLEKTEKSFDYEIRHWMLPLNELAQHLISEETDFRYSTLTRGSLEAENTEYDYGHDVPQTEIGEGSL